jgi:hypothetical protein
LDYLNSEAGAARSNCDHELLPLTLICCRLRSTFLFDSCLSNFFFLFFDFFFLVLHLPVKKKKKSSLLLNLGSGHNLDLSLGISNGSKGKDNEGDWLCT